VHRDYLNSSYINSELLIIINVIRHLTAEYLSEFLQLLKLLPLSFCCRFLPSNRDCRKENTWAGT